MTQYATDLSDGAQPASIQPEQLREISSDLFDAMLGMGITHQSTDFDLNQWQQNSVLATINIDGEWDAEVQVVTSENLAARIASTMFLTEVDNVTREEHEDAMREVANVIGGNVKGVVGKESLLGLPKITTIENLSHDSHCMVSFLCNNEPMTVTVLT